MGDGVSYDPNIVQYTLISFEHWRKRCSAFEKTFGPLGNMMGDCPLRVVAPLRNHPLHRHFPVRGKRIATWGTTSRWFLSPQIKNERLLHKNLPSLKGA